MTRGLKKADIIDFQTKQAQGYRWIDKDPIIDEVLYLCKKDGRSLTSIANAAYLSPTTLHNWDKGNTKKPNNVSIDFTLCALGYERQFVKIEHGAKTPLRWKTGGKK